jgi:uncharacterized protein YbjQ (UPF0145 family)
MNLSKRNRDVLVMAAFIITASAAISYAFSTLSVKGQASVIQGGQVSGSDLGQSIKDLTQGIIAGTNEQVQNTLENAGNQALPQLQQNASEYDCLIVVMNFGKAHGAMTCSPNQSVSTGITVNSANAPGFSSQSSIQRQGGATSMQNQVQGSGSSANVIPGNVP